MPSGGTVYEVDSSNAARKSEPSIGFSPSSGRSETQFKIQTECLVKYPP